MTKTGYTFTSISEAEEAWQTMRNYLYLASRLDCFAGADHLLKVMDRVGRGEDGGEPA